MVMFVERLLVNEQSQILTKVEIDIDPRVKQRPAEGRNDDVIRIQVQKNEIYHYKYANNNVSKKERF